LQSAALLRQQLEDTLGDRIPSAFSPRSRVEPEQVPCGIAKIDGLLRGGIPVGMLSEFVGPESSGRTTIALALVAGITSREKVAAWIDVADTLDPETVAANGVALERLLWVRCGAKSGHVAAASAAPDGRGINLPVSVSSSAVPVRGGGSPHPRSEDKGMPQAISAMMQAHGGLYDRHVRREKKSIGTPGVPNRPLVFRSQDREEQVSSDRVPSHRSQQQIAARCAEPLPRERFETVQKKWVLGKPECANIQQAPVKRSWDALDQALKVADLLLQGGGFSLIVLDLGSIPAEMAWRIPLATWFRFRTACERTQVSLLVLTQHPCTRSSAGVVLRMPVGQMEAQNKVMTGIAYCAEAERQNFGSKDKIVSIRKQPHGEYGMATRWSGGTWWAVSR
jgi:recombination protein RecA